MEKTNKKNKKSKSSLIALLAAILLCVAIVLGMGGYTYAKYISSKQVESTTANVAKWGWQVGIDSDKWFGDAYGAVDGYTNNVAIDYPTDDSASVGVKASSTNNAVVAPGTEGSLTFNITGSAEVRSKITVGVADNSDAASTTIQLKWTESENSEKTYEPITWTLKKQANDSDTSYSGSVYYTTNDDGSYSIAESGTAVENVDYKVLVGVLNSMNDEDVAPGENYDYAGYYKLSWVWNFQNEKTAATTDDEGNTTAATYYDLEDTILGAIMGYDSTDVYTIGPDGQKIKVTKDSTTNEVQAQVIGANESWDDTSVTSTTYTATTTLAFGLTITVEQIQGTSSSESNSSN